MAEESTKAWVPSKSVDGEWLEAKITAHNEDGSVTLETLTTGEAHTQPSDKLLLANELPEEGVENMTRLNYLHEPALLDNLRHRFSRDHVYTYTGKICIAATVGGSVAAAVCGGAARQVSPCGARRHAAARLRHR